MRRRNLLLLIAVLMLLGMNNVELSAQPAQPSRYSSPQTTPELTPQQANSERDTERKSPGITPVTVVGALVLVLGVFFVAVWLFRQAAPAGFGVLPSEAFESLGRARLTARQHVHLLRCGNKVLLVSVGTNGAETLTEFDEPEEVERLVELCRRPRSGAASAIRQALARKEGRDEA